MNNNAYLHLGISPDATIEEIERAYEIKRRLYEPSRFIPNSLEQQEAQRMSLLIELAYNFASAAFYASHPPQPAVHTAYPTDDRPTDYPSRTQQSSINAREYSPSLPVREAPKRGHGIAITLALLAVSVLCLAAAIFFNSGKPNGKVDTSAMLQREGTGQTVKVGNTGHLFSTQKSFKAFRCKVDVFVLYEFKRNQLCSISFLLDKENAGDYVDTIIEELADLYGTDPYEDYKDDCHISYSWKTPDLFVVVNYTLEDDREWVSVNFHCTPLKFGK